MSDATRAAVAEFTSEVVAAYVAQNHLQVAELPKLIASVHEAFMSLGQPPVAPEPEKLVPAVSIRKSVTDDYIISLEDGRKLKSMKRYLAKRGMTPADYRAKWSLPSDYPMVAPAYTAKRSELAKGLGLGRNRVSKEAVEAGPESDAQAEAVADGAKKPGKRGAKAA